MPEPAPANSREQVIAAPGRNVQLDAMRGVAAVSVVCSHLRQTFFVPYRQAGPGWLVKVLYIDHYVARAAVIFFFVLSGYLVGMSVLKSISESRWSWRDYLLNRLTRLYVVLVPALLLTALLDWIGRSNSLSRWAYLHAGEEIGYPTIHFDTVTNFFGNLFFLQNIHTGLFGSNSALWSLSFEFWYYILFPVIALTLIRRKGWLVCALFLAGMTWFLGSAVAALFPCWLAGVAIGIVARGRPIQSRAVRRLLCAAAMAALLMLVALTGAHRLSGYPADYAISLIAMVSIWVALSAAAASKPYALAAVFLSEMSYTLYLTHLPCLLLMERLCLRERLWPADPRHVCFALLPLAAALVSAWGIYWLFERNTDAVRRYLRRQLNFIGSEKSSRAVTETS
jgi:peptidoglycan/LPS O-acetylase OafA/YrhL